MIRIARPNVRPSIRVYTAKVCTAADRKTKVTGYERELEKATSFFADLTNFNNEEKLTDKNFKFSVYKNTELVQELDALFHTKCAYCESDFGAVSPKDIEHYRPKGEISTGTVKLQPGYWWIAGDFSNLLISCTDCNRPRTHKVPGQAEGSLLGKGTQFPLSDETVRVRAPGGLFTIEDNARLLLNPCIDNPEEHLEFDATGNVQPRLREGIPSRMGEISINVYALRRKGLVEKRLAALGDLAVIIDELNDLVLLSNDLIADGAPRARIDHVGALIEKCTNKLFKMFDREAQYLAAKRDWIRSADLRGAFNALRAFRIEPLDLLNVS